MSRSHDKAIRPRRARRPLLLVALGISTWSATVWGDIGPLDPVDLDAPPEQPHALRQRVGALSLGPALGSSDDDERLRAINRLSEMNSVAARLELLGIAEQSSSLTDREALTLIRALSNLTNEHRAEELLVLWATGAATKTQKGEGPLAELVRSEAALALAANGSRRAIDVLGRMLQRGGDGGVRAQTALLAHPPRSLDPLLSLAPSVNLANFLTELGDQRAFARLRHWVRTGTAELRAAAALALTLHGHGETVELARYWVTLQGDAAEKLLPAALLILLRANADGVLEAFEKLYSRSPESALELARAHPSPRLVPALLAAAKSGPARTQAIRALGQSQTKEAIEHLTSVLRDPELGDDAAVILGRVPRRAVEDHLNPLLKRKNLPPGLLRRATLAAVVAFSNAPRRWPELDVALTRLARSKDPALRWWGAWGRGILDPARALEQLAADDPITRSATAASALLQNENFFIEAARPDRLTTLPPVALLHPAGRARVPNKTLFSLTDEDSTFAALAVRALCERVSPATGLDVAEYWLASPDVLFRSSAALGLAERPEPGAAALLVAAVRFEPSQEVRAALTMALGHRLRRQPDSKLLKRELRRLGTLDPSPSVRALAWLAVAGRPADLTPVGREAVLLRAPSSAVPPALDLALDGIFSVPVLTSPGRISPVLGLRGGSVRVRLASATRADEGWRRGPEQNAHSED